MGAEQQPWWNCSVLPGGDGLSLKTKIKKIMIMKPLGEKDGARLQCQGISPSSLPVLGHADAAPLHWPCDCSAEGSLPGCWAGGGGKVCVCVYVGVSLAPL